MAEPDVYNEVRLPPTSVLLQLALRGTACTVHRHYNIQTSRSVLTYSADRVFLNNQSIRVVQPGSNDLQVQYAAG